MYGLYFIFPSATKAYSALTKLTQQGIKSSVVSAPSAVSSKGCAFAVKVSKTDGYQAAVALKSNRIDFERTLFLGADGIYREILL